MKNVLENIELETVVCLQKRDWMEFLQLKKMLKESPELQEAVQESSVAHRICAAIVSNATGCTEEDAAVFVYRIAVPSSRAIGITKRGKARHGKQEYCCIICDAVYGRHYRKYPPTKKNLREIEEHNEMEIKIIESYIEAIKEAEGKV